MTKTSDEEHSRWAQMEKNLDVMFQQVSEMYATQKQMKAQMDLRDDVVDAYGREQHLIATPSPRKWRSNSKGDTPTDGGGSQN